MADTFTNDLRLRLQESGGNSGTWGTLLNTTITNLAEAFSYGSEAIANASTHTITLQDGTSDEARSMYLKCTGGGQACTVTLAPNTISKLWFIENATSHTLTFSQGSGANVAVAAGAVKVIATDGAGSGAAVYDALVDLDLTGTTTMASVDINGGNIDGTTIGGSTAAAGTFTTITVDTDTLVTDATNNRVGVGTASPSTKLHLGGTAPGDSIIRQDSTASGTNWEIGERAAGKWQIFEDDTDSVVATFMSSGNVAIGSPAGSEKLSVAGSITTDGYIYPTTDNGWSLGLSTNRWGSVFAQTADFENSVSVGHSSTGGAKFAISDSGNATIQFFPEISTDTNLTQHYDLTAAAYMTSDNRAAAHIFKIGTSEAMRITSGNVGIGETSPDGLMHIKKGNSGTTYSADAADQLILENSGSVMMDIRTPTGNTGGILFSDAGARGRGIIQYAHSNDTMYFNAGGAAAMDIDSSGVNINGSLSKGSGSFKIDHPLPAKTDTHHLVHSFVEAPQADNIYRGTVDLVDGSATVSIDTAAGMTDGTFVLLNTNVQCFTSNESGWTAIKGSVSGNTLTITAQENTCTDTISWMVVGERQDQHMIDTDWTDDNGKVIVEPLKQEDEE